MLQNIILKILFFPSKLKNFVTIKRKNIIFGKNSKFRGSVNVYGQGKLIIGNNTVINSCESSNPIGGMSHALFSTKSNESKIVIGDNTGISNSAFVAFDSITIGNNVKIGGDCKFYDSDFHSIDFIKRRERITDVSKTAPIIVKDDAFIGAHSIILKGVTIGERAVIGAGSVVTKSVPDDEIWAGNPARFIKKTSENCFEKGIIIK